MAKKPPGILRLFARIDDAIQAASDAADSRLPPESQSRHGQGRPPTRDNIPRVQVSRANRSPAPPNAPQQPVGPSGRPSPPQALDMPVGQAVPKRRLATPQTDQPPPAPPAVTESAPHEQPAAQEWPEPVQQAIATHAAASAEAAVPQSSPPPAAPTPPPTAAATEAVTPAAETTRPEAPTREPMTRTSTVAQRSPRPTPTVTTPPRPKPIEAGQLAPGFVRTGAGFVLPGPPVEVPLPPAPR